MSDPVRRAKRVADLARCSRIAAGQYIKGGWVSVDGRVVEDPAHPVAGVLAGDPVFIEERAHVAGLVVGHVAQVEREFRHARRTAGRTSPAPHARKRRQQCRATGKKTAARGGRLP